MAELIYDLINRQFLCSKCPKQVKIQYLRSVEVYCYHIAKLSMNCVALPPCAVLVPCIHSSVCGKVYVNIFRHSMIRELQISEGYTNIEMSTSYIRILILDVNSTILIFMRCMAELFSIVHKFIRA